MNESLSNMCGHLSFVLLGTSYITSDIFHLRVLAMSGISLSILFQYYRPIPLFIPIRWNALFLLTNAGMIAALLSERNEANKMSDEERELYDREFKQMGFTSVEYYRLIRAGSRRQVKRGSHLCVEVRKWVKGKKRAFKKEDKKKVQDSRERLRKQLRYLHTSAPPIHPLAQKQS